jgi:hypothetical protein
MSTNKLCSIIDLGRGKFVKDKRKEKRKIDTDDICGAICNIINTIVLLGFPAMLSIILWDLFDGIFGVFYHIFLIAILLTIAEVLCKIVCAVVYSLPNIFKSKK